MIARTACISFPRSGHHALTAVLRHYFGDELKYCDNYNSLASDQMKNSTVTNFQKEHDLTLDYPLAGDVKYLIQIRNPIHAIQSWIDFDAVVTGINANKSPVEWRNVFSERLLFWKRWYKKWVLSDINPRLVVEYESLIASPVSTLQQIILFMTNGRHADDVRLKEALERFPLEHRAVRKSSWVVYAN
jgi:hypothetical protein